MGAEPAQLGQLIGARLLLGPPLRVAHELELLPELATQQADWRHRMQNGPEQVLRAAWQTVPEILPRQGNGRRDGRIPGADELAKNGIPAPRDRFRSVRGSRVGRRHRELLEARWVGQEPDEGFREGLRRAAGNQEPIDAVFDEVAEVADLRDDCRKTGHHRLHQGQRESLRVRCEDEHPGPAQPVLDVVLLADEADLVGDAELRGERFHLRPQGPIADDHGADARELVCDGLHGAQEQIHALDGHQPAGQDQVIVGGASPALMKPGGIDPAGDDVEARRQAPLAEKVDSPRAHRDDQIACLHGIKELALDDRVRGDHPREDTVLAPDASVQQLDGPPDAEIDGACADQPPDQRRQQAIDEQVEPADEIRPGPDRHPDEVQKAGGHAADGPNEPRRRVHAFDLGDVRHAHRRDHPNARASFGRSQRQQVRAHPVVGEERACQQDVEPAVAPARPPDTSDPARDRQRRVIQAHEDPQLQVNGAGPPAASSVRNVRRARRTER
jgi:hypothetical protein